MNRAAEGWLVGEKDGQTGVFPEENIMVCFLYIIDFSYFRYKQYLNYNKVCRLNVLLLVEKRIIFIILRITLEMQSLQYATSNDFDTNFTWWFILTWLLYLYFEYNYDCSWIAIVRVRTFNFFKSFVWNTPPGELFCIQLY